MIEGLFNFNGALGELLIWTKFFLLGGTLKQKSSNLYETYRHLYFKARGNFQNMARDYEIASIKIPWQRQGENEKKRRNHIFWSFQITNLYIMSFLLLSSSMFLHFPLFCLTFFFFFPSKYLRRRSYLSKERLLCLVWGSSLSLLHKY